MHSPVSPSQAGPIYERGQEGPLHEKRPDPLSIDESLAQTSVPAPSQPRTGSHRSGRRKNNLVELDAIPDAADLAALIKARQETEFTMDPHVLFFRVRSRLRVLRRYAKQVLDTSVAGLIFDIFNVVLSLLACALYVYEADNETRTWLGIMEMILTSWFVFDFILRIVVADNTLETLTSRDMMIDILSILPAFADLFGQNNVSILGLMRVLKILRLLRIQRLLSYFGDDEVMKQGFFMFLTFTFVIFFGAGMYHYVENLNGALRLRYEDEYDDDWTGSDSQRTDAHFYFGTAAYFVVVTMTTVGFGDITPTTPLSQFVAGIMIMTTVIVVPFQTNELLNRISDQSIWNKKRFTPRKGYRHVLVAGTVNSNGLANFVQEFFNADQLLQAEELITMVIMAPRSPAPDVLELLQDPQYSMQVIYIAGSILSSKDLRRAAADSAEAIWLLSNKFALKPGEEDALTILRSLKLKRFLTQSSPGTYTPVYTQLIQPENRPKLAMSEQATNPDSKSLDQTQVTLCIDEMKMVFLARSCLTPGVFTVINNLVTSGSGGADAKTAIPWEVEYKMGGDHEIYRVRLAEAFDGQSFFQTAAAAFDAFRVVLIAVEQNGELHVAPSDFTIRCAKHAYGYVITEDSSQASQVESYERKTDIRRELSKAQIQQIPTDPNSPSSPQRDLGNLLTAQFLQERKHLLGAINVLNQREMNSPNSVLNGRPSLVEALFLREGKMMDKYFYCEKRSLETASIWNVDELLPGGKHWVDIPKSKRHIVVCGFSTDLYHFMLPLRTQSPGETVDDVIPVVLLAESISDQVWNRLRTFPRLYFIKGSPLSTEDLLRAGVQYAQHAVVLASPRMESSNSIDNSPEGMKAVQERDAMADADTIFINSALHTLNPDLHVVSEIVHNTNMPFINEVHMQEITDASSEEGPWFAAGHIYVASLNDYLSAQLYHNPRLVSLIEMIVVGDSNDQISEVRRNMSTIDLIDPFSLPDRPSVGGWRKLSPNMKWKTIMSQVLKYKAVPIGLYRGPSSEEDGSQNFGNRLPYVVTNPPPEVEVRKQDRVFCPCEPAHALEIEACA